MKPTDPQIVWLEEKPLGLAERLYLPLFVQGLATTARHMVSPKVTVSFPDERPTVGNPLIYRGVHRLNKDEQGRVQCVACFLCATACPAHCIDIVAAESPWPDREKYPGRASRSTNCAASSAECARRPVRSTRSS